MSSEEITVNLEEHPTINLDADISDKVQDIRSEILKNAKEAKEVKDAKSKEKMLAIRETQNAIVALLESPPGLTKQELLLASDTENLSSIVIRIKNYLKKQNLYTLKKRKRNKITYYYLDPIR